MSLVAKLICIHWRMHHGSCILYMSWYVGLVAHKNFVGARCIEIRSMHAYIDLIWVEFGPHAVDGHTCTVCTLIFVDIFPDISRLSLRWQPLLQCLWRRFAAPFPHLAQLNWPTWETILMKLVYSPNQELHGWANDFFPPFSAPSFVGFTKPLQEH